LKRRDLNRAENDHNETGNQKERKRKKRKMKSATSLEKEKKTKEESPNSKDDRYGRESH